MQELVKGKWPYLRTWSIFNNASSASGGQILVQGDWPALRVLWIHNKKKGHFGLEETVNLSKVDWPHLGILNVSWTCMCMAQANHTLGFARLHTLCAADIEVELDLMLP